MNYEIRPAQTDEFLDVAALDRIAWPIMDDTFIPDGERIITIEEAADIETTVMGISDIRKAAGTSAAQIA